MSERGNADETQSPVSSSAHIEQLCDDFEKACRAGRSPLIEEVLLQAPPGEQDRLLADLLEIELDCRQRQAQFLQVEEYRGRFPDRPELVDSVFRRAVKTRRLGDYELLEELGRGGMGAVYKARQIYLNQVVAIKILPYRFLDDPTAVSRFLREMQSYGALNDPNIVRAYNAGAQAGVHFLVMEYVDGINLQRFITLDAPHGGPLGVGAACEIVRQAACGLQHAYEHQLVHRDIKPANLMLSRDGQVKILDLGLAKLRAEAREEAAGQESLTRPGMTMGTVDYMAPEQWESPAAADIRADIYSLGCTLFFLLTGEPPYAGADFDNSRKKLMAHVVAPIPSLVDRSADVPEELQEIFARMAAKKPADRFATPAEVAEAVAEFADAEELAEVIAELPRAQASAAAGAATGRTGDTHRQPDAGSGSSRSRRRVSRWTLRQRFRRNVTIGISAGLAAGLVVLAAYFLRPHRHANALQPTPPAVSRESPAAETALLPGLNGPWWFDEAPWFLPFVREALGQSDAQAGDYLNPNTTEAYRSLAEACDRCRDKLSPAQQALVQALRAKPADADGAAGQASRPLEDALRQFTAAHSGEWSAADLHTAAVLQHAIAARNDDKTLAAEARKSYEKALQAYAAQPPGKSSLRPLCLADAAMLSADVLHDFKDARQRVDEALAGKNLPVLFRVGVLVQQGRAADAAATDPGDYQDHWFTYAKRLLEGSDRVKPGHPLAAWIDECYAASLLDQWKVEEASKLYQAAHRIRLNGKESNDPLAAIYVFQDRRNGLTASRYRGNLDSARRGFKTLAGELQAAAEEADHHANDQPRSPAALRAELAHVREAWADCELFGGAASGGKVNLAQAADSYEQARKLSRDPRDYIVLGCKLAVVQALAGKQKEAAETLAALDDGRPPPAAAAELRPVMARQLAEAVVQCTGDAPEEGRRALRTALDHFRLNPPSQSVNRRERIEARLFAAELLLTSDLDGDSGTKPAQSDLHYLDNLLDGFESSRDMRPYLRRYFELAVRACDKNDLVQIAHYLLESRMADRQGAPSSRATLVIFSFAPKENFVLFVPQDRREGRRFDLDFTRDHVKSAKGKPLRLNDELVARVKADLDAHRPLEIFWDDTPAWPSEDPDALTAADWPFAAQLQLPNGQGGS